MDFVIAFLFEEKVVCMWSWWIMELRQYVFFCCFKTTQQYVFTRCLGVLNSDKVLLSFRGELFRFLCRCCWCLLAKIIFIQVLAQSQWQITTHSDLFLVLITVHRVLNRHWMLLHVTIAFYTKNKSIIYKQFKFHSIFGHSQTYMCTVYL